MASVAAHPEKRKEKERGREKSYEIGGRNAVKKGGHETQSLVLHLVLLDLIHLGKVPNCTIQHNYKM